MPMREASKGPEAFRTISEASSELGVPQHVLRFWETKFSFIRPMKRAGGRRFYRRQDLEMLRGVRVLLHEGGYTIKGVQRLHKEAGVRRVIGAGEGDIPPPASTVVVGTDSVLETLFDDAAAPSGAHETPPPQVARAADPDSVSSDDYAAAEGAGVLKPPARARLESVLRDLERVKASVDGLLSESDG